jgi:hypothetical protein
MKTFPIYDAKPLPDVTALHRKNVLGLRSAEKKGLDKFLEEHGVGPRSWLLDGWLSTRIKRVSPLRQALFIAEWAQQRKGFHPLEVLVAMGKYEEEMPKPSFRQAPPSKEALSQILQECRSLSLDSDEDFNTLIETLIEGIVTRSLF